MGLDKYLKKPPFRFLHDIIMEVTKVTGFCQGLFSVQEADATQLQDKNAKIDFLNKPINAVSFALGEKIDVSANKIDAGLEPEKTNGWLQKLHLAATTAMEKSDEAVQRVLNGESMVTKKKQPKREEEPAVPAEPSPPPGDMEKERVNEVPEEDKKKDEDKKRREKKRDEEKKRRDKDKEKDKEKEKDKDKEKVDKEKDKDKDKVDKEKDKVDDENAEREKDKSKEKDREKRREREKDKDKDKDRDKERKE